MHAIRQHEYGSPETLRYEEVPDPEPAEGQVRIVVEAAGVHLLDTVFRQGTTGGTPYPPPPLPTTPGREVAGTVDALGTGVDESWLGRRVVTHLGPSPEVGGYVDRTLAAAGSLHDIPDGLDAPAAVAMIGTGRTAVAVLEVAGIAADDVVLVTAAAGGLGSLFLQAARNAGALPVGVAGGPDKLALAQRSGAAVTVDYLQPDWPDQVRAALADLGGDSGHGDGGRDVSLVLDGVGGEAGRAAFELLGVGGRLVMFGASAGAATEVTTADLMARSLTVTWGIGARLFRPGALRAYETASLAEAAAGRLVPVVQTFPLAEAAKAHAALETRQTVGKVVLVP
jgi:NADPH:quinone reductase